MQGENNSSVCKRLREALEPIVKEEGTREITALRKFIAGDYIDGVLELQEWILKRGDVCEYSRD